MRVFISEADKQNAYRIAISNIAKFYSISDWEYDDNDELIKKIGALKSPLYTPLLEYLKAYNEWFDFYMDIKKKESRDDKEYDLNEQERFDLSNLIRKRQESLDNLQNKFDQEQFEKFKKINGLQNIGGINLIE